MNDNQKRLFDYQKKGVKFLVDHKRAMLCDEVGLGKTVQVIISCQIINARNVLVVCPACMRLTWEREFKNWCTRDYHSKWLKNLKIISYAYLQKKEQSEKLGNSSWDVIVCDESQNIKSPAAKQTRHFINNIVLKHTGYLWLLSATPATKSAGDYFTQLSVIEPGKWGKYGAFLEEYCHKKKSIFNPRGFEYYGFRHAEELRFKIKDIVLRRKKNDVEIDMPERIYGEISVDCDKSLIAEELSIDLEAVTKCIKNGSPIPAHIASVRQAIGLSKVISVADWLVDFNKPIVVFCWHKSVITALSDALCDRSINHCMIRGEDNDQERQYSTELFSNSAVDVILLSIAAAGVGISLPRAEACVFVELPWSPAVYEQAIGRLDRCTNQNKHINIYDVISDNLRLDRHVKGILNKKSIGMSAVIDGAI